MKSAPAQVGRPRGTATLHTFKVRRIPGRDGLTRGEVSLERLKADLERGIRYFYDHRPELSRPSTSLFNT